MKYIKKYEVFDSDDLKLGDFIIACDAETLDPNIKNFVENEIGILNEINDPFYLVKYEGVPKGWEEITKEKGIRGSIPLVAPFYRTEIRKATSEEVKKWKLRKEAEKYNL